MSKYELNILHLYPKEMNLYGDHGNILTLEKRCKWRNIRPTIIAHEIGSRIPDNVDIIFGGGGQDSGQQAIQPDLFSNKSTFHGLINSGIPCLVICGLYQLFGHSFQPHSGNTLRGISIFDLTTIGKKERLIGNVVADSNLFGQLIGYENHSGRTHLQDPNQKLAHIIHGAGNNGCDYTEGAVFKNAIGTYLHGPLLPNNPIIADFLIQTALKNKYHTKVRLQKLDDSLVSSIHSAALKRKR